MVDGERAKNLPAQLDCTRAGYSPFRRGYTFAGFSTVEGSTTAEYRGTLGERSAYEALPSGTRLHPVWLADEPTA